MAPFSEECDRLRQLLRLSMIPTEASGHKDAGVLIILSRRDEKYCVFLCLRSEKLRRHPGEVCFPGGMKDEEDQDLHETAMREAEEEVGLLRSDYEILGSLPSFRSRFGVVIHPTVALLRHDFDIILNPAEVQSVFWKPLEAFLEDEQHDSFDVDARYSVHSFYFEEAVTYGVTALMSVVVAMGVLQQMPLFDLTPQVTLQVLRHLTVNQAIDTVFFAASKPFRPKSHL